MSVFSFSDWLEINAKGAKNQTMSNASSKTCLVDNSVVIFFVAFSPLKVPMK